MTRTIPATQLVALLLAFVLVAGAGGVLTAGLTIPLAAGANAATEQSLTLFDEVPDELKPGPLSQASTVLAADGSRLATFYAQNRIVVPLDQVSDAMKNAVVAIEDERFYKHAGIDPYGMMRAFVNNALRRPQQGASTLTQQYVKNVLIDEADRNNDPFGIIEAREDSNARKAREAKLAIALEQEMSKDEILQGYLNVAQFGKFNIYGVETAARYFFNKSAKDLTPVEAATIAGITKAPAKFDPSVPENQKLAQARRDAVLNKMWALGYLPTDERDEALATPLADTLHITPVPTGCQAAGGSAFFCVYVISEIKNNPAFGESQEDRLALLYRGGLTIHTTLDIGKQLAAEQTVAAHVPNGNDAGLEAAVVTVEPGTGKILAMAQNVPFDGRTERDPGTTSVNYSADPLHGASGGFQPGSNFKPFVLAQWLKEGHTLWESVSATKVDRPQSSWHASCRGPFSSSQTWGPGNAEGSLSGNISVLRATYESVNTAYASMSTELDLCGVAQTAWDMGYRPTKKTDGNQAVTLYNPTLEDVEIVPAMVLGSQTTSPLQLAAAFGTLASNGTYCAPIAITQVTQPDGTDLPVPSADCNPNALAPNIASTVVYAMEKVFTESRGTGRNSRLADGRVAAGKTGTNQGHAQTWFTGFTPQLVTTVWVGEASGETSHDDIWLNGVRHRPMYGSSVAAPLWQDYMNQALAGAPFVDFPEPDQNLVGTPPPPPAPPTPPVTPPETPGTEVPTVPTDPIIPPPADNAGRGNGNGGEGHDSGGGN